MSKIDKEFDEKFNISGNDWDSCVGDDGTPEDCPPEPEDVKQFIKQKILEITDEMIGEVAKVTEQPMSVKEDEQNLKNIGRNIKRQEIIDITNKYLK